MVKREQSLAGLVRQRLPEFEEKFYFGIRQQVVVDDLNAEGYEITLSHFKTLIHLARKRAKKKTASLTQEQVVKEPFIPDVDTKKEAAIPKNKTADKKYKKKSSGNKDDIGKTIRTIPNLDMYSQKLKDDKE
jgi:hypothetical protein